MSDKFSGDLAIKYDYIKNPTFHSVIYMISVTDEWAHFWILNDKKVTLIWVLK